MESDEEKNTFVYENSFFFRKICVNIIIFHIFYNLTALRNIQILSIEWERAMMRPLEPELGPGALDKPAIHLAMTCQVSPFAAKCLLMELDRPKKALVERDGFCERRAMRRRPRVGRVQSVARRRLRHAFFFAVQPAARRAAAVAQTPRRSSALAGPSHSTATRRWPAAPRRRRRAGSSANRTIASANAARS